MILQTFFFLLSIGIDNVGRGLWVVGSIVQSNQQPITNNRQPKTDNQQPKTDNQ